MTTVAVITRTKDRPVFLKRAIKSVASQSYNDYVHVVVNDGGDREELNGVLAGFDDGVTSRIKVFHREQSSNAPDTIFSESIDRVDSQYFAIHDDDDSWHEDFLKHTVACLESDDSLGAAVVRADRVDEEMLDSGGVETKKVSHWMPDMKVVNLYRQCIDNQLTPIATLFRRTAYEEVGKFDDSLPVIGDWEFGIRLLQKYDVEFIDPGYALANYHHRRFVPNSTGNSSFSGSDKHRYYTNKVINRYLRQELAEGKLGVGYIMSKLKYEQGNIARMAKKLVPGFIVQKIKGRIQSK